VITNRFSEFKSRIVRASSWAIGGHVLSQLIRLASNMIMTRLLVPEMFGVIAIANVFILGLAMFSDLGLKQNIVQSSRGTNPVFLNTIWSIQIIRGFIIGTAAFSMAYGVYYVSQTGLIDSGNVYADPVLPLVIAVLAFGPIISGFESTKLATANRNISLGKITIIEVLAQLAGIVLMLAWVYQERSIWALVAGSLFSVLTKTCLSHLMLQGESNRLQWDKNSLREAFHFGKWIFLSSILGFLINSGDKLLFGAIFSSELLGIYSIAALMIGAMQGVIFKLISTVAFPALGEVNRLQPERIKSIYYKIRQPIDILCLFAAGFLFMQGGAIINLLYDDRYSEAGIMLEILSLGLLIIRFGVAGQFYMVCGQPKIMSILIATRLCFMIMFIPLGFSINQHIGAIWGLLFAGFPGLLLSFYYKKKFGILDMRNELRVLPAFAAGVVIGFALQNIGFN